MAIEHQVISADDHVVEPPDVFQRRLPSHLRQKAPTVQRFGDEDKWVVGDKVLAGTGANKANLKTPHDKRGLVGLVNYDTCQPGIWQPEARLRDYDADGKDGAVLYSDFLPGFTGNPFWSLAHDPELRLACLKAWNDWLIDDFCAVDSQRLVPLALPPVWDINEAVKEVKRCASKGHPGVLIGGVLDIFGYPTFFEPHWDPLWAAIQEADMVVAVHQQSAMLDRRNAFRPDGWSAEDRKDLRGLPLANIVWHVSNTLIPLIDMLSCGMLERFPRLKITLGEGGVGWIPYVIGQADFFWARNKSWIKPDLTMPPSEYWRRQCSAAFWYEQIDDYIIRQLGVDNIMWEDDYPHQLTDNAIDQGSAGYIEYSLQWIKDPQIRHKILAGNAVRLFNLKQ